MPVVAILATPAYREIIVEEAKANGVRNFAVLQDSRASVSKSARLGPGSIIGNGTIIASRTELGAHVFVNRGVMVGHDCVLEDYCTIAPGANIGGLTRVKTGAYIGIGATVFNKVTIGRNSIIAGGAVVTKDVPDNTMVAGVPAIIKKENIVGYRGA